MPEGPEIWRTADKLNDALQGKSVNECFFYHEELKPFENRLPGTTVKRVEPRGKALVTFFDGDWCMYSHNQLYGKWFVEEAGDLPDTGRSLRVALHNDKFSALLYSASEIKMMPQDELENHSYLQKLGPDVVHPDTTVQHILDQYENDTFQNRKLTTLLLDQAFLSGVGNYLRSEILFDSKISPSFKLRETTDEQKQQLAQVSRKLARRSYETKGITNNPTIVEALKREGASRREYRHFAYGRADDRCYRCGTEIEVMDTGGRKLYYCPSCQSK